MTTVLSLYKQLMDLHVQIAPESFSSQKNYKLSLKNKLEKYKLYTYTVNDKIIGIAIYFIHKTTKRKTMFITDFIIDESERGKGFGKKLLKKLHDLAKSLKCNQIHLSVADKNIPAKSLYQSLGYKVSTIRMYKKIK